MEKITRVDKRIKHYLVGPDTINQDDFMFNTIVKLLDHSDTFLILILFWHLMRSSHPTQTPFWLCSSSNTTLLAILTPTGLLYRITPNGFNIQLLSFKRKEGKEKNNLWNLTCIFIILCTAFVCNFLAL